MRNQALVDGMEGWRLMVKEFEPKSSQRFAGLLTELLYGTFSQDTKAWSEHFFQRMALRFDARAAARASSGGAPPDGDAGVTTGNVRWWRCPKTRRVAPSCARLPIGGRANQELRYSAWHCMCSWREARRGAG